MDFLKYFKIAILLLILTSCSRFNYLTEQGIGQFSLLYNGESNQKLLNDPTIPKKYKKKIKNIQNFKKYFYKYWSKDPLDIYSKTTILTNKAVTYLVVASKYNEVSPKKECFPFMGCFPYLGFFKLSSAKEHSKKLQKNNYITWIRPVYAYSSLGYFSDRILSSFFVFPDYELAELIFHELFHTIFFIKDEVSLNESLANYFSREMAKLYFKLSDKEKENRDKLIENENVLNQEIVNKARELKAMYSIKSTREESSIILEKFINRNFIPHMSMKCKELGIDKTRCFPLREEWNNAAFSAFLTYEQDTGRIKKLREKLALSTVDFFNYIEEKYESYKESNSKKSFSDVLFSKI